MTSDQPKAPIAYRRCVKIVGTNRRCRSLVFDKDAIFCPRHALSQSSSGDVVNQLINRALGFHCPRGFQNSLKALYCLVAGDVISSRRANALVSITRMMMRNLEAAEKDNRALPRDDFPVPAQTKSEQVAPTPPTVPAPTKQSPTPQLPSPPIAASQATTPPQPNAAPAPLPQPPAPSKDLPGHVSHDARVISSQTNLSEPTPPTNAEVDQIVDQLNRAANNPKEFADQIFQLTDRLYPAPRRFEGRVRSEARDPYG